MTLCKFSETTYLLNVQPSRQPLPPVVRVHKKRTFVVAHPTRQEALEQRLAKRARYRYYDPLGLGGGSYE